MQFNLKFSISDQAYTLTDNNEIYKCNIRQALADAHLDSSQNLEIEEYYYVLFDNETKYRLIEGNNLYENINSVTLALQERIGSAYDLGDE